MEQIRIERHTWKEDLSTQHLILLPSIDLSLKDGGRLRVDRASYAMQCNAMPTLVSGPFRIELLEVWKGVDWNLMRMINKE